MTVRLIAPSHVEKMKGLQEHFNNDRDGEEVPIEAWVGLEFMIFGAAAVTFAIMYSPLFLLLFLIPFMHMFRVINFYLHSAKLSGSGRYGTQSGVYYSGLQAYRSIFDGETKSEAFELLSNIWNHETELSKVGRSHLDCKPCKKRVSLISRLESYQSAPGTLSNDIERVEHLLEGKKEIKELM